MLVYSAGGPGKKGTVLSIGSTGENTSYRSWVKVRWDSGITNNYRRGHDGKLDVKFTTVANGELYYAESLSKLGMYTVW
jgi:Mib_herc2